MTKFVQIGFRALNPDHITEVVFLDKSVRIFLDCVREGETETVDFTGRERDAFLDWWDNRADVFVSESF
jgi:hypothetical protein